MIYWLWKEEINLQKKSQLNFTSSYDSYFYKYEKKLMDCK